MNGIDAVNIVFDLVKSIATISGKVYRRQRPLNSNLEDIVINNLSMGREDGMQTGIINVNIHVPNLDIDKSIPNLKRLGDITAAVEALFPFDAATYNYEVQSDDLFEEEISSYVNLRIEFRAENINNY